MREIRTLEAPDDHCGRRYSLFRLATAGIKGDYDSDTMLITDHPVLIRAAELHYGDFKVPTNLVSSIKTKRKYDNSDKADLDVKTSVNKIGEIINLSQQANSLFWERIHKGATVEECSELYQDICKLAVLSGIEIGDGLAA